MPGQSPRRTHPSAGSVRESAPLWFEKVVESSTDVYLALDLAFQIRYVNIAGKALLGLTADEATERPISHVLPGLDTNQICRDLSVQGEFETDVMLQPGRRSHVRITPAESATDTGQESFLVVEIRERASEVSRQTTGTLRAIVDCSPVAIVTTNSRGQVILWNRAAERILGFTQDQMIGEASPVLVEPGTELHDRECRAMRADQVEVDLLCSAAPMFDANAKLAGQLIMFSDATERLRSNRQMEHSQKLESLGVLAGGVAHDFNNLLTGILGNASLCLYLLDEDNEAMPVLRDVVRAGERAAGLTRQLLAYAGKGRFVLSRIDLSDLTREMTGLARTSIQNSNVSLHMDLDWSTPAVEADAIQLQQVILNLVINGAESIPVTESGSVQVVTGTHVLSASEEQDWSTSEKLPPGQYAVLEVRDTGVGMDETTRSRIFEPFFSTKFTGRGLGLSAVLGIVRQHKGALRVYSEPGKGSSFKVFLPAIEGAGAAPQSHALLEDLQGEGLVLVVDDEETVRSTAQRALEHWNYRVIQAEHGQAAVEIFPKVADRLCAVILDLTMPVMGGEDALVHFRRMRKDVPVILVSGYNEAEAMRRMSGKGVAAFLQKPFTVEQLGRKLRDIRSARTRRANLG